MASVPCIPISVIDALIKHLLSGAVTEVQVVDVHDNLPNDGAEAVYVDNLVLENGSTLTLDDSNVYYRSLDIGKGVTVNENGPGRLLRIGIPGDFDFDDDVDLLDYGAFLICVSGPGGGAEPDCDLFDFDTDIDVDLIDFSGFQLAFTGSFP
jgi:hypothetical protein